LRACLSRSTAGGVTSGIRAGNPGLAWLTPGLAYAGDRVVRAAGGEERFRLFEAVTSTLVRAAAPAGLVVVLDDLHWADLSSASLLAHLARDLAASRVLIVATYRDQMAGCDRAMDALLTSASPVAAVATRSLPASSPGCSTMPAPVAPRPVPGRRISPKASGRWSASASIRCRRPSASCWPPRR